MPLIYYDFGSIAEWVGALGTVAAVLAALGIALYGESLKQRLYRPKLAVEINSEAPDCHKIAFTGATGVIAYYGIYYRLRIRNDGNRPAQNVQVVAKSLQRYANNERWESVPSFLPLALVWSHTPLELRSKDERAATIKPFIAQKLFVHCDFGNVIPPNQLHTTALNRPDLPELRSILRLDTWVTPNTLSNFLGPGKYRIEIFVAAENADPVISHVLVSNSGEWSEEERTMIEENLTVKVET
jgi:hypothetical protein